MEGWARDVRAARAVLAEPPALMPSSSSAVPRAVYESWRRSRALGLAPDAVRPGPCEELDLDTAFVRAVAPLVEKRQGALEQASCALSLTDQDGRMLRRWVHDPSFAHRLDALGVTPGFSVAESSIGTSSALTLHTGEPVLVRGPEHFSEVFAGVSCAGARIADPVSGRPLGSVDLTCSLSHTSPIVLAWVTEIATAIEASLRDRVSRRERLLLDAHLARQRSSAYPLVTLDRTTMISSAAAARMLGGIDQTRLWEHAVASVVDGATRARSLVLDDGSELTIATSAVWDGSDLVGAVLILTSSSTPAPTATRRPLALLEQAEADTIMAALRHADGNKHRAAQMLGIARSTLYRKARAWGLDLSAPP